MDKLDQIYLLLLVLSIPFGHLVKSLSSPLKKRLACVTAGISIVLLLVGLKGMMHSFIAILGNFVVVKLSGPRYCQYVSFVFVFGYLLFYRCCSYIGFPVPPKHSNAVQLLVTLRMVSLAFELHNASERNNNEDESLSKLKLKKDFSASFFDYFIYGYCYIGLMTGPFYTYQSFQDMLYQDGTRISTVWPAIRNLKLFPFLAVPYLIIKANFPLNYLESDECLEHSLGLLHILPVMMFTYHWYRWRYYIGWLLAESMCMTAGLGAYPFECKAKPGQGPTQSIPDDFDPEVSAKQHNGDTHDFQTIDNINVFEVEKCTSMRMALRIWNKTVQWWMARYIYREIPFKSKQTRLALLLLISAYWHGVHPGYYLAFAMVGLSMIADSFIESAMRPYLTTDKRLYWWSWLKWFFFFRIMDFVSVPFMYLHPSSIFKIWSRVYFIGLTGSLCLIILSFLIPRKQKSE